MVGVLLAAMFGWSGARFMAVGPWAQRPILRLWLGRAGVIGTSASLVSEGKDSNSDLLVGTAFGRAARRGGPRPPFFRWRRRRRPWPARGARREIGGGHFGSVRGPESARKLAPRSTLRCVEKHV